MPSIHRHGKTWRIHWREGGEQKTRSGFPSKTAAASEAARIEAALAARRPIETGRAWTMAELLQRWHQSRLSAGLDAGHQRIALDRLLRLCERRKWTRPDLITPLVVEAWRREKRSGRAGAILRGALRWAYEVGEQPVDPRTLIALRPPKVIRKPDEPLLSDQQLADIQAKADAISPDLGAAVHCLATYGWRPIDCARLTVAEYDQKRGWLRRKVKGGDVVAHPLLPETRRRLDTLVADRKPEDRLFLAPWGRPWPIYGGRQDKGAGSTLAQWWSHQDGLGRLYDLKRAAISRLLGTGATPREVADYSGHRTISQVLRYARTNETRQLSTLDRLAERLKAGNAG
jgi:hypothetical protein